MAKYGPSSAFILVGGCDLSGETHVMKESVEQVLQRSDGLGDSWEESLPAGKAKITLEASGGFYDDAAASTNEAFNGQGATLQPVSWGFRGTTPGAVAYFANGDYANVFHRLPSRDGLTLAHAAHMITGQIYEGKVLHGLTAETSDPGNTEGASSVDNLAATSVSWAAQVHVPALTLGGFTSLRVKLRHSTDDSTYADLTTFTDITAAGTGEHKSAAAAVNRHRAMSWDWIGAGAGQTGIPYVVLHTA